MFRGGQIYLSEPMTGLLEEKKKELNSFFDEIVEICKELGFATYVPHHESAGLLANSKAEDVFSNDQKKLKESSLVLAYVGEASFGVGGEIQTAYHLGIPVIIFHEKEKEVSWYVLGNSQVKKVIMYSSKEEAKDKIRKALEWYIVEKKEVCWDN